MEAKIKKIALGISIVSAISLGLVGCGGSSDSSSQTTTGQFIDSAVEGLDYSCSSGSTGTTNSNGEFTCNVGDTITFSLGNIILGNSDVATIISPISLSPDNDEIMANIAQLLQTLDSDSNPTNGITISTSLLNALQGANLKIDAADFDSVAASYIGLALILEEDALVHLMESLDSVGFIGTGGTSTDIVWGAFDYELNIREATTFCKNSNQRLATMNELKTLSYTQVKDRIITLKGSEFFDTAFGRYNSISIFSSEEVSEGNIGIIVYGPPSTAYPDGMLFEQTSNIYQSDNALCIK